MFAASREPSRGLTAAASSAGPAASVARGSGDGGLIVGDIADGGVQRGVFFVRGVKLLHLGGERDNDGVVADTGARLVGEDSRV